MNEKDKREVATVVAICAVALVVTYPKAVAVAAGSAIVLLGGAIWGARSLQS